MRFSFAKYDAITRHEESLSIKQSRSKKQSPGTNLSLHKLFNLQQPLASCCEVTKQSREKLKHETPQLTLPEIKQLFASLPPCVARSRSNRVKKTPCKKKLLPHQPQQQQRQSSTRLRTDKRPDLLRRLLQMRLHRLHRNPQLLCSLFVR